MAASSKQSTTAGRNFSEKRLERAISAIDEKIDSYVESLDEGDRTDDQEPIVKMPTADELREKTASLKERKVKYEDLSKELRESAYQKKAARFESRCLTRRWSGRRDSVLLM